MTEYERFLRLGVDGEAIGDVELVSPLLKNAVESLTASYDEDTDQITFSITADQGSSGVSSPNTV